MSTTTVHCTTCTKPFELRTAEYNRKIKRGWLNHFCSKDCQVNYQKAHATACTERLRPYQTKAQAKYMTSQRWANDPDTGGWREFLRRARSSTKKRDHIMDITVDYLKHLWAAQNGKCPYTGWNLIMPSWKKPKTPHTASLDRLDSSKGYLQGNVQFVSVMANLAKSDFTEDEMIKFCQAIASKTNNSAG